MLDAHLVWRATSVPHLSDGLTRVVTQGPARARAAPKSIVEKLVLAFGGEFLAAGHDQVKFLGGDSSGVEPPEIDHHCRPMVTTAFFLAAPLVPRKTSCHFCTGGYWG
jgi:hypothetical protein